MFKQAFAAVQASVVHLQGVPLGKRFALVPLGPPLLTYSSTAKVGECGWVGVGGGGGGGPGRGPRRGRHSLGWQQSVLPAGSTPAAVRVPLGLPPMPLMQ